MNYWVFKATPSAKDGSGYDYDRKLRAGREEDWHSVEAGDSMRVDDRVFFWASSPLRHVAGLGVITRINRSGGVRVRYLTNRLPAPPAIDDLKAHPSLNETRFFRRGSYSTAHLLTEAESRALYGIVVARNPSADVWSDGGEAPTASEAINPALFEIGAKFNDRRLTLKEARGKLVALGISAGSAGNYLYNTRHLLAGRCYKREMTIAVTTSFLAWIKEHRSPEEYQNSLQALEEHLQYRESSGLRRRRHRELLSRLRAEVLADAKSSGHRAPSNSARDDLPEGPPPGCEAPKQTARTVISYPRDPAVRDYVLKQAKGRCEYCGQLGFLKPDGQNYLESHHLLALSEDGPDTPENVVALCANHHREAHYGRDREKLEAVIVAKRQSALPTA